MESTKNVKAAADLYAPDFQDIDINNITCREARTAIKASGIEGLDCVHGITVRMIVTLFVTNGVRPHLSFPSHF